MQKKEVETRIPSALLAEICSQCERDVPEETALFTDALKTRFGASLQAVILYGSCMRTHLVNEGVVDLYAVVDDYANAYEKLHLRYMNACLPPNVFYLEVEDSETTLRAKYAVITVNDLERGCSKWFHSYIWSRFAQPVRLIYVNDDKTRDLVYHSLAHAVLKFFSTTIPTLAGGVVNAETIWVNGLGLTYSAELRPEQQQARATHITHQNLGDYTRLTRYAVPAMPNLIQALTHNDYQITTGSKTRKQAFRLWRLRRWQGKVLSILRLTKAAFTFSDCVDYAAWKIKRHTGLTVNITPASRRHPVLFGFSVLWQLLRRGAVR